METAWTINLSPPSFPELKRSQKAEIVVIGGGLTGVITAYLLAEEGREVILLEKDWIGGGATHLTTAFLTQVADTDLSQLVKMIGRKKSRLLWQSMASGIDLIEQLGQTEGISCEFQRCSYDLFSVNREEHEDLKEEFKIITGLGFDASLTRETESGFPHYSLLQVKNQAKFHPLKFLFGLASAAQKKGALLYEQTEVSDMHESENGLRIHANDQEIHADKVVICTYQPFNNPIKVFAKKGMYTTYVIEYRVPKQWFREGIFADQAAPYHYVRIDALAELDRVLVGGEDHRIELPIDPEKHFAALQAFSKERLGLNTAHEVRKWTGPILEPSDGIPLIGAYRANQYLASAFSGTGMTYAAAAAMLLRDQILERPNPYQELYHPNRVPSLRRLFYKGKDYSKELYGGALKNLFKR